MRPGTIVQRASLLIATIETFQAVVQIIAGINMAMQADNYGWIFRWRWVSNSLLPSCCGYFVGVGHHHIHICCLLTHGSQREISPIDKILVVPECCLHCSGGSCVVYHGLLSPVHGIHPFDYCIRFPGISMLDCVRDDFGNSFGKRGIRWTRTGEQRSGSFLPVNETNRLSPNQATKLWYAVYCKWSSLYFIRMSYSWY